ncbi:hypothetical protein DFP73DRAFT_233520 [Morchella snyderi]|nr:hypothetical protein DFP73DRAFT_233520 [Morchella snyderi]
MVKNPTQQSTEEPQTQRHSIIRKRSMNGFLDVDGWRCNCNPRLPAVKCIVRKKNHNHGRQYYKCPNADTGCKLLLWESEALICEPRKPLKQTYLSFPPTPSTGSRRHTRANPTPENVVAVPVKRRIVEDDTSGTELDSEREEEDVEPHMRWRGPLHSSQGMATPRKQRRIDTQSSPTKSNNVRLDQSHFPYGPGEASSSSNPRDAQLHPEAATAHTPSRPHPSVSFSENILTLNPVRRTLFGPRPRTPPPQSQPAYAPATPGSRNIGSPGRGLQDTLIADTFKLLERNHVNLSVFCEDLRAVLVRHVRQKEGISQGRDALRKKLTRKDLDIAETEVRIRDVEGRNETLERDKGRMLEKGKRMEAEVAKMRVRVTELEEKNETLEREKRELMEEKARMLKEEKRMKAEVASLTSMLGRLMVVIKLES